MKKITVFLLSVLLVLSSFALTVQATDVEVANANKPAVLLSCEKNVLDESLLTVRVSFSGCMGLESADLRFAYDGNNLTYLGGSLQGAAAVDQNVYAAFSDVDDAAELSYVAVSLFHLESFTAEEGNGDFCELAFRINGNSKIKAEALSFIINGEEANVSLGSCRYSQGFGTFLKNHGSAIFIAAVIAVILLVLIILLVVVRRMKKNLKATEETTDPVAEPFDAESEGLPEEEKTEENEDALHEESEEKEPEEIAEELQEKPEGETEE